MKLLSVVNIYYDAACYCFLDWKCILFIERGKRFLHFFLLFSFLSSFQMFLLLDTFIWPIDKCSRTSGVAKAERFKKSFFYRRKKWILVNREHSFYLWEKKSCNSVNAPQPVPPPLKFTPETQKRSV